MKVIDPQSALLTNAEVYDFLKSNKPRSADKKIGAYEPVKLDGYKQVSGDVQKYINETTPLTASLPEPQKYMNEVVQRLRKFNLTKTEVFSIINLGIGLPRPSAGASNQADDMEVDEEEEAGATNDGAVAELAIPAEDSEAATITEVEDDPSARYLLALVVEGLDERFPAEETEEKIRSILAVLRECVLIHVVDNRNGVADQAAS